ncbi:MAG: tetratricopeptide repeat protein [Cytophagia bacterium]|nr:tetratricopeptide repeat protein [Bacteroidota bacterium]MBT5528683.1 tetratricopeptide repeat protein [Cytophagia bacterium]MBT7994497.1 tetratricopeptide repeat protein [Bacteroidota bacterium]
MTKALRKFIISCLIAVLFFPALHAQQTLIDTDPLEIYNNAFELYTQKKFNAAIVQFKNYLNHGDDYLLKARSQYYIAMSAKELNMTNTEELFLDYLEKYPEQNKDFTVFFELGKFYFYKKKYENSLEYLVKLENPRQLGKDDLFEYYYMLGYCYFRDDNLNKALSAFNKIDNAPNAYRHIALYYIGYIHYQNGKYDKSLEKFLAIQDDNNFKKIVPAYITHIFLSLNKFDNAIAFGEDALKMSNVERATDIKSYMAEAYFQQKEYAKAIIYYDELKNSNHKFTESDHYSYGYCLFKNTEFSKAIKEFTFINIEETKFGQNISYLLATAYLATEDMYKARNMYSFVAKLNFDKKIQEIAALNYAKLSYELGFDREAITALKAFIKDYPSSSYQDDAKTLMSQILENTTNYKEAIAIIESLSNRNEALGKSYQKLTYYYGLAFFQNKNYDKAKVNLVKSIRTDKDKKIKALAYFWLGESYFQLKEYDFAQREYKNFLWISESRKTPYYSIAYYNIAYTYFKQEKFNDARVNFDKYVSLESTSNNSNRYNDAIIRTADCYMAQTNYADAINYYNKTINNRKQEVDYAMFQKATILGLQNKDDEKLATLKDLSVRFKDSPYLDDALFEIGNMLFMSGKFAQSQNKFNYLIQEFPRSPYYTSALLKIGQANYNLNNIDNALDQFKAIINQYPYSEEAKEAFNALREILIDQGKGDEVLPYAPKTSLTKSFKDSTIYHSAFSFVKKNEHANAIKQLENYLLQYPDGYFVVNANYYLAYSANAEGRKDLALEHYEAVNDMSPNEFVEKALKGAAIIFYSNTNYEKALMRFRQLEEIAVIRENVLLSALGQMRCHYKLLEFQQCIDMADKVLNLAYASIDHKIEAHYYSGKSNLELSQLDKAMASFTQVYSNNSGNIGAESKYLSAYIFYLKEDYDEALNTVLALKDDFSNNDYYVAKGFILLADVFVKMGDFFQAKSTLQSIIDNFPDEGINKLASNKLAEIIRLEKSLEQTNPDEDENEIEIDSDN